MSVAENSLRDQAARGGWKAVRVRGRLLQSPFAGQIYRAELGIMPLHGPGEFANTAVFEQESRSPILLCPSQRYVILSEIVREARARIPDLSVMLVRLCGPDFAVQLTADLLAEDVLLTHEPDLLVQRVLRSGRQGVLTVSHNLRTDGYEPGDNEIILGFYGQDSLGDFLDTLDQVPVLRTLKGLSVSPILSPQSEPGPVWPVAVAESVNDL
jgi:hypothetical protein